MPSARLIYCHTLIGLLYLLVGQVGVYGQVPVTLNLIWGEKEKELHGVFPDSSAVFREIEAICAQKHFDGYLEAGLDSLHTEQSAVLAFLHEGPRYSWLNVYRTDTLLKNARISTRLVQRPVSIQSLNRLQEAMLTQLANAGYPSATVRLDSIRFSEKGEKEMGVSARLAVDYGPLYRIDSLSIKGDVSLRPVVIKHLLGISPGMAYSRARIRSVQEKLNRLPFMQPTGPVRLYVQDSSVYAEAPVAPRRANSFAGILGLMPVNDQTGDLLLTGDIQLKVHNMLGYAEFAELSWQRLQVATQQLKVRLHWPYLFGTALGVHGETDFFRIDTSFFQLRLGIGFAYRLQGLDEIGFFLRQRLAQTIQQEGQTALPAFPEANTVMYGIQGKINRLDHPVNPRRGVRLEARFALGEKVLSNDSILAVDSIRQKSLEWQADMLFQRFQPVGKRMTVLTGFQGGWMENPFLYLNDLYRIGGMSTLRGFDEEALYVSRYAVATLEWRLLLDEFSWISVFADGGYIQRAARPAPFQTPVYAMGAGITFDTPAGLFSIMYAVGASENQALSFDRSKIHFGYSARF